MTRSWIAVSVVMLALVLVGIFAAQGWNVYFGSHLIVGETHANRTLRLPARADRDYVLLNETLSSAAFVDELKASCSSRRLAATWSPDSVTVSIQRGNAGVDTVLMTIPCFSQSGSDRDLAEQVGRDNDLAIQNVFLQILSRVGQLERKPVTPVTRPVPPERAQVREGEWLYSYSHTKEKDPSFRLEVTQGRFGKNYASVARTPVIWLAHQREDGGPFHYFVFPRTKQEPDLVLEDGPEASWVAFEPIVASKMSEFGLEMPEDLYGVTITPDSQRDTTGNRPR